MQSQSSCKAELNSGSLNLAALRTLAENMQMGARNISKRGNQIRNSLDRIEPPKKTDWKLIALRRSFQSFKINGINRIGNNHNLLLRHIAPFLRHLRH